MINIKKIFNFKFLNIIYKYINFNNIIFISIIFNTSIIIFFNYDIYYETLYANINLVCAYFCIISQVCMHIQYINTRYTRIRNFWRPNIKYLFQTNMNLNLISPIKLIITIEWINHVAVTKFDDWIRI